MKISTKLYLEATPDKIYAMLKLIEFNKYTKQELLSMVQPKEKKTNYVFKYIVDDSKWAKVNADEKYVLCIDKECLRDIKIFRMEMNNHLFEEDRGWYFEFTKWYLSQDEDLLQYSLIDIMKNNPEKSCPQDQKAHLSWRLWSSFLGFGNLQGCGGKGEKFIPNPYIRILDMITMDKDLPRGKSILFKDFIIWLIGRCPELEGCIQNHNLTVFLSLALRVLHDMGKINLETMQDATDMWYLTQNSYHDITSQVTNIEIMEV